MASKAFVEFIAMARPVVEPLVQGRVKTRRVSTALHAAQAAIAVERWERSL